MAVARSGGARFRREQTARWEQRRLAVYADHARTLKRTPTLTYRVAVHFGNDRHPHLLSPEEAAPQLAEAALARDPSREALLMLGRDPAAWQALMERQRAGRAGYYTAVRDDLALPPGHSARWQLPSVRQP
ncbi:hypothetical protein [Streptomyces sp. NBC_00019]|uniref:hypothetical protein n=1 Tax=Streptomyces sp. NBC_00019 TaxID=2975623 RepID=UPI0032498CE5